MRPDGLWQLTPRGIFEIDPKSGDVRRIFRGKDLGSVGGDLLLTDSMAAGCLQSHDHRLSPPRRPGPTSPPATTPPSHKEQTRHE